MFAHSRLVWCSVGVLGLVAGAAVVAIGCGGVSPFLTAQFLTQTQLTQTQTLQQLTPRTPEEEQPNQSLLGSVCDLDTTLRGLTVTLSNESQSNVHYSLTFVASAGVGGFVCDAERQNYINAGYAQVGTGNTATIGCDTVTLTGTQILAMEFDIDHPTGSILQPAVSAGGTVTPFSITLARRDTSANATFIPLPEIIVFGNDDPLFLCLGTDLRTQRGFVYTTNTGIQVGKAVEAARIQGTLANTNFGSAPEWRVDRTLLNNTILDYQYVAGGTIIATVLDRSSDPLATTRNQVVWLVSGPNGENIHSPNR
jgi:hypothetical protein